MENIRAVMHGNLWDHVDGLIAEADRDYSAAVEAHDFPEFEETWLRPVTGRLYAVSKEPCLVDARPEHRRNATRTIGRYVKGLIEYHEWAVGILNSR